MAAVKHSIFYFLPDEPEEFSLEVKALLKENPLLKCAVMLTPLTSVPLTADEAVSSQQPKLDFKSPSAPQSGRQQRLNRPISWCSTTPDSEAPAYVSKFKSKLPSVTTALFHDK